MVESNKRGRGRPRTKFGADIGVEMFGEKAMRALAGELAVEGINMNEMTIEEAQARMRQLRKERASGTL